MSRLAPDDVDAPFIRRVVIVAVVAALVRAGDLLILVFGSALGAITIDAIAERGRDLLADPQPVAPRRARQAHRHAR